MYPAMIRIMTAFQAMLMPEDKLRVPLVLTEIQVSQAIHLQRSGLRVSLVSLAMLKVHLVSLAMLQLRDKLRASQVSLAPLVLTEIQVSQAMHLQRSGLRVSLVFLAMLRALRVSLAILQPRVRLKVFQASQAMLRSTDKHKVSQVTMMTRVSTATIRTSQSIAREAISTRKSMRLLPHSRWSPPRNLTFTSQAMSHSDEIF